MSLYNYIIYIYTIYSIYIYIYILYIVYIYIYGLYIYIYTYIYIAYNRTWNEISLLGAGKSEIGGRPNGEEQGLDLKSSVFQVNGNVFSAGSAHSHFILSQYLLFHGLFLVSAADMSVGLHPVVFPFCVWFWSWFSSRCCKLFQVSHALLTRGDLRNPFENIRSTALRGSIVSASKSWR